MHELRPGLWTWTARHPEWTPDQGGEDGWEPDVGCYAYVPARGRADVVLFDPLFADDPSEAEPAWQWLDDAVEQNGPPTVLLTIHWHTRSAHAILERFRGARVWAYEVTADEVRKRTTVTDTFAAGDALPGGVEPHGVGPEAVFWLPEHRALVVDDVLIAAPGKPLRVWSGGDEARRLLRPLLDLPTEMVLLTHGPPVLERGREALAAAIGP